MTNSHKPNRPSRRRDGSREPPTIDLKATVIEASAPVPEESAAAPGTSAPDTAVEPVVTETPADETAEARPSEAERAEALAAVGPPSEEVRAEPMAEVTPADAVPTEGAPETMETPAEEPPVPPVTPPPTRAEPARSAGFGSLLAAGILGGLVGAGALWGVQTWQDQTPSPNGSSAQLQQQLGAYARQDAVRALEGRLATLETGQQSLGQRAEAAQQAAERAAARAEEALNRPQATPAAPTPAAPDNSQAVADLDKRVAALELQVQNRLGTLESQIQERSQSVTGTVDALQRQVAETAETLQGRIGQEDEALRRQISDQNQRLTALSTQVEKGGSEATRAGIRVVLADRLGTSLAEGAPYAEVLPALQDFGVDPARLSALEPYAQNGAPTPAALAEAFRPLGDRIVRESRAGDSWSDRLLRMADRVVTVRAVDQPGSGTPSSLVARIEAALAHGNLAEAAAAWDSLPEPSRRLSESWGQELKRRAAAEAAARDIAKDAVSALNTATR